MTRLASRFGAVNLIRRDRPLTNDELARHVPSIFSEEKHHSRSARYSYIPTITLLDNLRKEGFQPFFACQTRVRNLDKQDHTKHLIRLRREDQILGKEVPEIILLNSHDGSSSYQMLPGLFRFVCANGLICGDTFGEVRVPHLGPVVDRVIEGAYEVLGIFDRVEEQREAMQSITLSRPAQQAFAHAALTYRYGEEYQPVTEEQILMPLRYDDSLIGLGAIVFNGEHHHQLSGDTFILNQHHHPYDRGCCHTYGHPYRFMVMAVLLLAHHTCPNVWKITSDFSCAEWQHVADWLQAELAIIITLPTEIFTGAQP